MIEIGQIWREDDKRVASNPRFVKVFSCMSTDTVGVFTCDKDGIRKKGGRETWPARRRFGRAGGYQLFMLIRLTHTAAKTY